MTEVDRWIDKNIPAQDGKLFLVTGANSGLGYESTRGLARKGATVLMACRSLKKGKEAAETIKGENPRGELRLMELDLADLSSVRKFAEEFQTRYDRLDALVNNAGVMATPYGKTADGFELQFGINHLGHFALTGLLLDVLKATPESRVVTVSSYAHWFGWINFGDLNAEKFYYRWMAYTQSKLANLLFAYELQRQLVRAGEDMVSVAAHPGSTVTQLQQYTRLFTFINGLIGHGPQQAALPILYAAAHPDVHGGDYFGPNGFLGQRGYPHKALSSPIARNEKTARRLWEVSESMTGVKYVLAR
jgi:NAD(P)-dependent dehydrogenase (short-subunit alcohol dehydrogenase family)